MVGGMLALVGAIAVGPRIGRFDNNDEEIRGHTVPVCIFFPLSFYLKENNLSQSNIKHEHFIGL